MQATEVKPSTNGVFKIARRGRIKIEFEGSDGPFEIDVIEVYDQWVEMDWLLRDKEGELPMAKWNEHGQNRLNFVQAVVNDAYAKIGKAPPTLTRHEAQAFIVHIQQEVATLRDFLSPKKEETSSSLANTGQETRFSQ